jgi:hypothetical protein
MLMPVNYDEQLNRLALDQIAMVLSCASSLSGRRRLTIGIEDIGTPYSTAHSRTEK